MLQCNEAVEKNNYVSVMRQWKKKQLCHTVMRQRKKKQLCHSVMRQPANKEVMSSHSVIVSNNTVSAFYPVKQSLPHVHKPVVYNY